MNRIKDFFKNLFSKKRTLVPSEEKENTPSPTLDTPPQKKKRKRLSKKTRIIIVAACCAVVVAVGTVVGVYADKLLNRPQDFFDPVVHTPAETPKPSPNASDDPEPTISDYEQLAMNADKSMMQNIVNICLIGVDYAEERETWNGKHDYHADVIMVLAINFDENTASLISIPRDTYAKIPGVDGIYKINAALNCGGGYEAENGAGFQKVCEAASWMLGDISVDYYYAVTMHGLKDLVDAIGGVDFDLDMDFKLAGRSYQAGPQHMDGQGVLDYLRVRKNAGKSSLTGKTGDLNRIDRQKEMMVAIFETLKSRDMIGKIPEILDAFDGQLYTNTNLSQTAALALFAYNLDTENISMHSMSGSMANIFNWSFCLTDQSKRVEIIKKVYGIDVPKYDDYSRSGATSKWQGMLAAHYLDVSKKYLDQANSILMADRLLAQSPSPSPSESIAPAPSASAATPTPSQSVAPPTESVVPPTPSASESVAPFPSSSVDVPPPFETTLTQSLTPTTIPGRAFGPEEDALYDSAIAMYNQLKEYKKLSTEHLTTLNENFRNTVTLLGQKLGIKIPISIWKISYEKNDNEVYVDFR